MISHHLHSAGVGGIACRVATDVGKKIIDIAAAGFIKEAGSESKGFDAAAGELIESGAVTGFEFAHELAGHLFKAFLKHVSGGFAGQGTGGQIVTLDHCSKRCHAQVFPGEGVPGVSGDLEEAEQGEVDGIVVRDVLFGFAGNRNVAMGPQVFDDFVSGAIAAHENGATESAGSRLDFFQDCLNEVERIFSSGFAAIGTMRIEKRGVAGLLLVTFGNGVIHPAAVPAFDRLIWEAKCFKCGPVAKDFVDRLDDVGSGAIAD